MSQELDDDVTSWDGEFAKSLIGAKVLVGLTNVDSSGKESHVQNWGYIKWVCENKGICLQKPDGSEWVMPPALEFFQPAEPGSYNLKSSGDVVVDPDYLLTFSIMEQDSE